MNMIPNYFRPYPDELLYSWICRLAKANGLHLRAFCNAYLGLKIRDISLSYDPRFVFSTLFRRIPEAFDPLKLYLTVTTLAYESTRMSHSYLEKYVNNSFQPLGALNSPLPSVIRRAFVCPECMAEDTKRYGEPYLHRCHHLNGVAVCHKHEIPLLEYRGKTHLAEDGKIALLNAPLISCREYTMDFNMDDYEEVTLDAPLSSAAAYAEYAYEILQAGVVADARKVNLIILHRLAGMGIDAEEFFSLLGRWKHKALLGDLDHLHGKILFKREYNDADPFLFLMFLFPDPADAVARLKAREPDLKKYTCPDCGEVFCSAAPRGWTCPVCTSHMPDDEVFKLQAAIVSQGEYIPITSFRSMHDKVVLCNVNTGREMEVLPRVLLHCETFPFPTESCESEVKWEWHLRAYLRHAEETGKIHISCGFEYRGFKIGKWYHHQVALYKSGKLLPYRKDILLRANPEFFSEDASPKYTKNDRAWDEMFGVYIRYVERKNTLRVPSNGISEEKLLGEWVMTQRRMARNGRMDPSRMERLLSVDPDFFSYDVISQRIHDELAKSWNDKCDLYEQLVREKNSFYICESEEYGGVRIGHWLHDQRVLEKQNRLLPWRRARLLDIDPCFFSPATIQERMAENKKFPALDKRWNDCCDVYEQFVEETGSIYIPTKETYHDILLGRWVWHQIEFEKAGKLSREHKERLLKLDSEFFAAGTLLKRSVDSRVYKTSVWRWHHNFDLYKQYVKENNSPYIPARAEYCSVKIGKWVLSQRRSYKQGTLLPEYEQALLSVDEFFFDEEVQRERYMKHRYGK